MGEMDDEGPTMAPCPDCHAPADARCADDCPRIAGQTGMTFDGTQTPVVWVPTKEWEVTP